MAFDLDDLRKEEGFQLVFPDKWPPVGGGSDGTVFPDDYFRVAPSIELHSVGDINGDGLADFATRVDLVDDYYPCEGPTISLDFVVFGVPGRPADILNLADIYRDGGGVIVEHSSGAYSGSIPQGVGDVDGDGLDDWSVSFFAGQEYDAELGSDVYRYVSYVIPGEASPPTYLTQFWASQLALSRVENAQPLYWDGVDDVNGVVGLGDVNADGFADVGYTVASEEYYNPESAEYGGTHPAWAACHAGVLGVRDGRYGRS